MLKVIRRNANAAWVKFIFVAIVAVFIFWGVGGGLSNGEKSEFVARVNNEPIEPVEFQRSYNHLLKLYQDVYKDNFKPEIVQGLDLKGKAVDQLIRVSLMRQEAERIGLRVSEIEVRDAIAAMPSFQQDGRFNKELYLRALSYNRLTPGEFEAAEREELLVTRFQDMVSGGVYVSEAEARDRFRFDNEKINLSFVRLEASNFVSQVNPSEDEVRGYFEKHQDTFREPDRVRIEYVLYPTDKFEDKAEVSDESVQRYYDDHQSEYSKPEQVRARHILLKVAPDAAPEVKEAIRKRAEELLAKAKGGEDFAALAKQNSEDPGSAAQGGDLGFFGRGRMVPPFEEAAFGTAPGEISAIVESTFGFHIIKVEAKEEAHTQTLDEVRAPITTTLKKEKARALAFAQAGADQRRVSGGEALAAVAQAAGLSVAAPSPFAQSETIEGLGRSPLINAAFTVEANAVGPVVDVPTGVVVFRVSEKIAAHVPELTAIRSKVEQAVRHELAAALAKTKADALLAEAQKTTLETAAQAAGYTVDETGPFSRSGGFIPKIGGATDLRRDAFQLDKSKPLAATVYAVSDDSVVAALKETIAADEEQFKKEKDNLIKQAEERRKGQVMEEFVNYLKARANIDLNQDFLASVPDSGRALDGPMRRRR